MWVVEEDDETEVEVVVEVLFSSKELVLWSDVELVLLSEEELVKRVWEIMFGRSL